jgi:DNA-binding GntR family transcriptional regulator
MAIIAKGPTLSEQVYAHIREKIVNDHYKPGQVIVESELAHELEVSRTPVSNAVIMLKERGLIEDRGGRACVLDLSIRDVIDLYQCRLALDGLAARLAAERITDEELASLEATLGVWSEPSPGLHDLWLADLAFHDLIYLASRNAHLRRFSEIATDLVATYRRVILDNLTSGQAQQRGPVEVRREHDAMFRSLKARDGSGSEAAARAHIESVLDYLERIAAAAPAGVRRPFARGAMLMSIATHPSATTAVPGAAPRGGCGGSQPLNPITTVTCVGLHRTPT